MTVEPNPFMSDRIKLTLLDLLRLLVGREVRGPGVRIAAYRMPKERLADALKGETT